MNALNEYTLKKTINAEMGEKADFVDFEAQIDDTLTYHENKELLKENFGIVEEPEKREIKALELSAITEEREILEKRLNEITQTLEGNLRKCEVNLGEPKTVCVKEKLGKPKTKEICVKEPQNNEKGKELMFQEWRKCKKLVKCPLMKDCLNSWCESECKLFRGYVKDAKGKPIGVKCAFKDGLKYKTEESQKPFSGTWNEKTQLFFEGWVKK
jgi:hypothetical protein